MRWGILFFFIIPHTSSALEIIERPDDQLLIMTVRLERTVLHDGILVYADQGQVYLPLSEMVESLSLPIEVKFEDGYAAGWFRDEDNRFVLDVGKKVLNIGGISRTVDWDKVELHEYEIYIESSLFKEWFELEFDVFLNVLVVKFHAGQWLPLEQKLIRQRQWQQLSAQVPISQTREPSILDNPQQFVGWPSLDYNLSLGYRRNSSRVVKRIQNDLLATGDLLWLRGRFSGNYSKNSDSPGQLTTRLLLQSESTDEVGAIKFQLGDFTAPALPLVSQQQEGVGFMIGNFSQEQSAEFDAIGLRGDALNGWDAEVYRNNQLVAFQTVDDSNRYEFNDVPVQTGLNLFRVVLYGPQGQVQEKTESFIIGPNAIPKGKQQWSFAAQFNNQRLLPGQEDFLLNTVGESRVLDDLQVAVLHQRGLSNQLSLNAAVSRVPLADEGHEIYTNVGISGGLTEAVYNLDLSVKASGATALRGTLQKLGDNQNWQAEYSYFQSYESPLLAAGVNGELLAHRAQLNWNGKISGSHPIGVSGTYSHFDQGRDRVETQVRYTSRFESFNLSSTLNHRADDREGSLLAGGTLLSIRSDERDLNAQFAYQLRPTLRANNANITSQWRLDNELNVRANFTKNFMSGMDDRLNVSLSKKLTGWIFSLSSIYNLKNDLGININIFSSINRTGLRWTFDHASKASTATIVSRVFLDNDVNGVFSEGDEGVSDVRLRISSGRPPDLTDENGRVSFTEVSTDQVTQVYLVEGSLSDPYWIPVQPSYEVQLRPGQSLSLDFPLVQSAEIDGTVRIYDEEKDITTDASNVIVELLDESDQLIKKARTSFDGFYLFDEVLPGQYQLKISPQQLARLGLETEQQYEVLLGSNGDVKSGFDFLLTIKK